MKKKHFTLFLKDFALSKTYLTKYIILFISIIFFTSSQITAPKLQSIIINMLSDDKKPILKDFIALFVVYILIYIFSYIFDFIKNIVTVKISEGIAETIREKINSKLERISSSFFENSSFSDIVSKVSKEVVIIKRCGITMFITLFTNILTIIVVIPLMLSIDYIITIIIIITLSIYLLLYKKIGLKIQEKSDENLKSNESMIGALNENYDNWLIVRLYGCFRYARKKFLISNKDYKQSNIKLELIYLISGNLAVITLIIGVCIIWFIGGFNTIRGTMSLGDIILLINYQNILFRPVSYMSSFLNDYHTASVSIKRIYEFLDYEDEESGTLDIEESISQIQFNAVSFSYKDNIVLQNCSITFEKGKIYGIYGASGTGKSTILKLILKIYPVSSGEILINQYNIDDLVANKYREKIGIVTLKSNFYVDTILNNLNLDNKFSKEKINELLSVFDLSEDINEMENNIETVIHREHSNLSEGQSRRLDLVRVFLKNPDVLIFDEATSSLDEVRREKFYQLLEKVKSNKIVIMISHIEEEKNIMDVVYKLDKFTLTKE